MWQPTISPTYVPTTFLYIGTYAPETGRYGQKFSKNILSGLNDGIIHMYVHFREI